MKAVRIWKFVGPNGLETETQALHSMLETRDASTARFGPFSEQLWSLISGHLKAGGSHRASFSRVCIGLESQLPIVMGCFD